MKKTILCPHCEENDYISYHGNCEGKLYFHCEYCEDWNEYDDDFNEEVITLNARDIIPHHIPQKQWDKYVGRTYKITNAYWYQ